MSYKKCMDMNLRFIPEVRKVCWLSNAIIRGLHFFRYLQKTITPDSGINKHDVIIVFKSIFSSSLGLDAAVEFLENNYYTRLVLFFNDVDVLSEVLYAVSEKLFTDKHVEWIKDILNNAALNDYEIDEYVKSKIIVPVSVNNYWKNHYQSEVKNVLVAPSTIPTTKIPTTPTTPTTSVVTTTVGSTDNTPSTPSTTTSSCENISLSKFVGVLVILTLMIL